MEKDIMANKAEVENKSDFFECGEAAIGSIEADENQQERLDEFTERLSNGEFHVGLEWDENRVSLARCVDGRSPEVSGKLAPNSAGGTESVFVADDLTSKNFSSEDNSTLGGFKNTIDFLKENDYEVGGHTDSHAHDDKSGCGANDKLPEIYKYISENGKNLQDTAQKLGLDVSEDIHKKIIENASSRDQFSSGKDLLNVIEGQSKSEFLDKLEGDHNEVAVVINTQKFTTLDRNLLQEEFGQDYQSFNVDVWAFEDVARSISPENASEEEIESKVIALTYYNLATALVLSGPKMRVITI